LTVALTVESSAAQSSMFFLTPWFFLRTFFKGAGMRGDRGVELFSVVISWRAVEKNRGF
jgi:hypothetical protein